MFLLGSDESQFEKVLTLFCVGQDIVAQADEVVSSLVKDLSFYRDSEALDISAIESGHKLTAALTPNSIKKHIALVSGALAQGTHPHQVCRTKRIH